MSKDPILRMFIIIIIGVILFQLLFNVITGGSHMGDMSSGSMIGNSATTLDSFVSGLLVLLVKLLIIALIISLMIGILIWIKKYFFKNINLVQYINQNPMMKSIFVIAAAIAGLILLIYLYNYLIRPTGSYGNDMAHMSGEGAMGGFSGTLGIAGILTFLIKVLTYVFVITLFLSLVAYFKKVIETGEFHLPTPNSGATGNVSENTDNNIAGKTRVTPNRNSLTKEQNNIE